MGIKRRYTGLQIESGYVKLIQAQDYAGSRKIVGLIIRRLASASEEDIIGVLRAAFKEIKAPLGKLIISIPRHKVTVRFLQFPSVNEKEIEGMVRLQSEKELPYSKEELISDYLITQKTKDGYSKVALVIVHKDVVDGYLNILKKLNLEPERITFSSEAILDWYDAAFKLRRTKAAAVLLDVDSQSTDIMILYNSGLAFTRGLNLGAMQLQASPDAKNKLVAEVKRTIETFSRQEKAGKIERILLIQSAESVKDLGSALVQRLRLPCETLSPLKNLSYSKEALSLQNIPEVSLVNILGVVLDLKRRRLNLLPAALRKRQELNLKKRRISKTYTLFLVILLLNLSVFAKKLHNKQLQIFYLDREIKKTAPKAQDIENKLKKIELIKERRKITGSSIDILRELHNLKSEEIFFSIFNYNEEAGMLTLQGISRDMSDIFNFMNALGKSVYFKNVQLKYVSEKKAKDSGFIDFKIECTLER